MQNPFTINTNSFYKEPMYGMKNFCLLFMFLIKSNISIPGNSSRSSNSNTLMIKKEIQKLEKSYFVFEMMHTI